MASAGRPIRAVSLTDINTLIAAASRSSDPQQGLFGPGSASWRINRESTVFLGAGRAALLQLAHPWVAAALEHHSDVMSKPIRRFHNTFRIVYTMIFGSLDQATAAARYLYALHTEIQGELTESTAGWQRGARYQANEVSALRWVFATLVESAELAWTCALGPMPIALREQYYADSIALAALFGLPQHELPPDWNAFTDYNRAMHAGDELGVSSNARAMAHNLLSGANSWMRIPRWYRALTIDWLPPRLREQFNLIVNAPDRKALSSALPRIPRFYAKLPPSLRYVGPWHEAEARLAGRKNGLLARLSNRFWIGQSQLPFAKFSNS